MKLFFGRMFTRTNLNQPSPLSRTAEIQDIFEQHCFWFNDLNMSSCMNWKLETSIFHSFYAMDIAPYSFYRKIMMMMMIARLKYAKKIGGHHARLRENDNLPLWRAWPQRKSRHVFNVRALIYYARNSTQ